MPKTDTEFDPTDYAPVADRIALFYERYPEGRIITELVSRSAGEITFRALIYRTSDIARPAATGWASEREGDGEINAVACLENAETSAIGRALANLGFTASRQRPSREEMVKTQRAREHVSEHRVPLPVRMVREPAPAVNEDLQQRAGRLLDALDLVAAAEREGIRAARADRLRMRLLEVSTSEQGAQVRERIELLLRRWLSRQRGKRLAVAQGDHGSPPVTSRHGYRREGVPSS
ncbi:MAG TPA: hypothetical protein VJ803_08865 [Gemmatimonadaceae bacterium]|nr:hypothetical protein [Gemmatimonadaceae bacterium]